MPWKASSVVEERTRFVMEYERGLHTMAALCRIYGVSRPTGHAWWNRYRERGLDALRDLGRAPQRHPNQTPEPVEQAVLELREDHMTWGPRKLKAVLQRDGRRWPAASTIGAMVARAGLVSPRRRRRRVPPYTQPFAAATAPNRVWCADFKGWFRTGDGARIDPLTLTDAHSRYLLRCQAVDKTDTARAQAIFEAAFREYGLPEAIRSDNGAPFASRAIAGLSRLSVGWMKLGIVPERIQAGHPEQNGRHERMHRTLKQETASPPAAHRRAQQRAFDRFRREYNEQRPHEALGMQTPASLYAPSPRPFPDRVREPEYPSGMEVRRVQRHGQFYWNRGESFISEVLAGERIGLEPVDERYWCVYFADFPIACFDSRELMTFALPEQDHLNSVEAGEGEASPSPAPHPLNETEPKVLSMSPV
jgi:transposase InsO family protein